MSYLALLSWAVLVLIGGAVWPLAVWRSARLALGGSLTAVVVGGALCLAAGVGGLSQQSNPAMMQLAWPMPMGVVHLAMDGLSAWFLVPLGVLSMAAAIYSWGYLDQEMREGSRFGIGAYGGLLCLLVAALIVVFCAGDAVLFLVAWEAMALSSFLLILFHDRDEKVRIGAWFYLIAPHLGTAICLFPLFALLIVHSGSTEFAAFGPSLKGASGALPVILFILGLIGFGTKAGFMPMHVWLPQAHPVAPSPVSAMLSGIVIKTGIYGILRMLSWLPKLPMGCAIAMLLLAAATGIMGILYALGQGQIKRLLAYSSVENIGIIGLGIGVGMLGEATGSAPLAALGFAGAMLHVLNHATFKGLLFLSAGAVLHGTGTAEMERLGGLAKRMPVTAGLFLAGALAICALPPLNGLVGEWLIYSALFSGAKSGQTWSWLPTMGLTALALIGGLALACFAKVFTIVFLGEPRDASIHPHRTNRFMLAGMIPLAGVCLLIGLCAAALPSILGRASSPLLEGKIERSADVAGSLDALAGVTPVFVVLVGLIAGLLVLRWMLPARRQNAGGVGTWGCGYRYASPRVQYTGSSFAWSLIHSFRPLLRPRVQIVHPAGYFPTAGQVATSTPDGPETYVYRPMFTGIARLCQRLWPLQHGRVQLYLIYMVATLLIVFTVDAFWAPYVTKPARLGGSLALPNESLAPPSKVEPAANINASLPPGGDP